MKEKLEQLRKEAVEKLKKVTDKVSLDKIRIEYLGKKGEITKILRNMGNLPPSERPIMGKLANELRNEIQQRIEDAFERIKEFEKEKRLKQEIIDVTLPGKQHLIGKKHPLSLILDEIKTFFVGLGYEVVEGPEIEFDYYNFEALNTPADHPARDEQDTFYITENILLRTQTSPVQVRIMESRKPPLKIIAPGRVYRADTVDATHSPVFHQVETLAVGKNLTLGDLKGTLIEFAKFLFGPKRKVRFRPHFFPFTEPSAEFDISCNVCNGEGCRVCSYSGWLEILGCGMVHPRVLEMAGYDPKEVSGFAVGMGVERIAMLKYGIDDLRLFFENDMRFLKQF